MKINPNLLDDKYTTNEQRIGTWINNKPLYRKTYNLGSLPNATQTEYALNLTTNDIIVYVHLCGVSSSNEYIPIPRTTNTTNYINFYVTTMPSPNTNKLQIVIIPTMDIRRFTGYAIVEYYKTTD